MSDTVNQDSSAVNDSQNGDASEQSREDSYVPKKAFQEVSTDMHKFKNKYKSVAAELEAIKAEREAERQSELERQNEFQKLYEEQKAKAAELENSLNESSNRFKMSVKKNALKSELGDVKDEYLMFANLDEIELLDDGRVDPESLHKVANDFRQNHPSLISKPKNGNITGDAPSQGSEHSNSQDLSKMSYEEKIAMYMEKLKK